MGQGSPNLFILTGAYDDQYLRTRKDRVHVCTSAGKRITLYRAIEQAAGKPVVLLSPQPRGDETPQSLPANTSRFGSQVQLFAKASGVRKIRFALDMLYYARHVAKHTRSGDVFIVDNYELIYVLAIQYCRLLGRRNRIILEYEDGKHLIDKGIWRRMSGLAEWRARPWLEGAILATPTLGERLPPEIPKVLVPGILREEIVFNPPPAPGRPVAFLYSGSLDVERGGPLLLSYLEEGKFPSDFEIHITGQGHFTDRLLAVQHRFPKIVHFHGTVSQEELARIRSLCHFGLNLQSSSHPISTVTYPSKTFDYLNAGIRVISTKAAGVEDVLGNSAIYLKKDTIEGLEDAILMALEHIRKADESNVSPVMEEYSFDGTCIRLAPLFATNHSGKS
jgi:hypothetical protein